MDHTRGLLTSAVVHALVLLILGLIIVLREPPPDEIMIFAAPRYSEQILVCPTITPLVTPRKSDRVDDVQERHVDGYSNFYDDDRRPDAGGGETRYSNEISDVGAGKGPSRDSGYV